MTYVLDSTEYVYYTITLPYDPTQRMWGHYPSHTQRMWGHYPSRECGGITRECGGITRHATGYNTAVTVS